MYTIQEIVAASDKIFDKKYSPALVEAALKAANISMTSIEKAVEIVKKFANRRLG